MSHSPLSRQRLYTSPDSYRRALGYLSGLDACATSVADLEALMAARTGARHAVCTNQARSALYFALRVMLSNTDKREVILSPYTIFDVVNMVLAAGGQPVFVDIEPDTCNIAVSAVERAISPQTAVVVATHLHGIAADIGALAALCEAHDIPLVEDTAQALGSKVDGRWLGTIGAAGVLSFGMMKNVVGFHGGMLLTDDDDLQAEVRAELARLPAFPKFNLAKRVAYGMVLDLATWPPLFSRVTFPIFKYGYVNEVDAISSFSKSELHPVMRTEFPDHYRYRMSGGQASVVLGQVDGIEADVATRLSKARRYHDALANLPGVVVPPLIDDGSQGYLAYPIQVEHRDALIKHLFKQGRDCAAQHLKNCADLAAFAAFKQDCPNARATAERTVLLPTYPGYGDEEVDANIDAVRSFFQQRPAAGYVEPAREQAGDSSA